MKKLLLVGVSLYAISWAGAAFSGLGFGDPTRGNVLYSQRCAVCHGQDGRGQHGMAPDFFKEWHRLTKTDDELAESIRNDFRSPDGFYNAPSCPSHHLTDEDVEDILAYLRQLTGPGMDDPFGRPPGSDPFANPMETDPFDRPIEFR